MNENVLNYSWLRVGVGCTNEEYLNWMIGLFTARDTNIEDMNRNGIYRKFVSCGHEGVASSNDMISNYKRFQCIGPNDWVYNQIDFKGYEGKWPIKNIQWIITEI